MLTQIRSTSRIVGPRDTVGMLFQSPTALRTDRGINTVAKSVNHQDLKKVTLVIFIGATIPGDGTWIHKHDTGEGESQKIES